VLGLLPFILCPLAIPGVWEDVCKLQSVSPGATGAPVAPGAAGQHSSRPRRGRGGHAY